jgi:hypothetical protein
MKEPEGATTPTEGAGPEPDGQGATTSPSNDAEFKVVQITDQTGFKLPKDVELPDVIKDSIKQKDETIGSLAKKEKQYQQQLAELSQKLESLQAEPAQERPDPIEDPEGYENYLLTRFGQKLQALQSLNRQTTSELGYLQEQAMKDTPLPEGYSSPDELSSKDPKAFKEWQKQVDRRYEDVLFYMQEEGLLKKVGDVIVVDRGNARRAYRDYFFDEIVQRLRGEGLRQAQETIAKAETAPANADAAMGGEGKTDYFALRQTNPQAAKEYRRKEMEKKLNRRR